MKAQTPPRAWAWAMMWLTSVVFPEDSGPKISTIRPRGTPPMPRARSSASEPVGIASTLTVPLSPSRIKAPSPNSFLMPLTVFSSAASFAFASFAETSFKLVFLSAISNHLTAAPSGQLDLGQRHVARTEWLKDRTVQSHADGNPGLCQLWREIPRSLRDDRRSPRSPRLGTNPGDGHMRPERPLLGLVEALGRQTLRDPLLQHFGPRGDHRQGVQTCPTVRRPPHRIAQLDPRGRADAFPQDLRDLLDLPLRPVAEEGEGDMKRLGRNRP